MSRIKVIQKLFWDDSKIYKQTTNTEQNLYSIIKCNRYFFQIHFEENGSNLATFMWIRKNEVTSCKDIYDYIFVGNIFHDILRFSNDILQLPSLLYISLHIKLLKSKIQFVRVLIKPLSYCTTILVTFLMMPIQQWRPCLKLHAFIYLLYTTYYKILHYAVLYWDWDG